MIEKYIKKIEQCLEQLYQGKEIIAYNNLLGLRQLLYDYCNSKENKNNKMIMNIRSELETCINLLKDGKGIQVFMKLKKIRKKIFKNRDNL